MKKTITSFKSPAPATKPAAAAKRAVQAPSTVAAVESPASKRRGAQVPASAPARFEPASASPAVTVISARIDIGFGNSLYLRGEGSGLAWHQGLPLENRSADLWTISLPTASAPLRFKFLINDETWSAGEDYVAAPGSEITLTPWF